MTGSTQIEAPHRRYLHRGRIDVVSDGRTGTTFTVTLPGAEAVAA